MTINEVTRELRVSEFSAGPRADAWQICRRPYMCGPLFSYSITIRQLMHYFQAEVYIWLKALQVAR
jgi:hypothetical protein